MHVEVVEPPLASVTVTGLHDARRPADGATDTAKLTVPEKPAWLARVRVVVLLEPGGNPRVDGFAEIVKS